jgi:hypothetical protein
VCGVFSAQLTPMADPLVTPFIKEFEETIYSQL